MQRTEQVFHHNEPVYKGVVVCNIPVTMDYDDEVILDYYEKYMRTKSDRKARLELKAKHNEMAQELNRQRKFKAYSLIH